LDQANPAPAPGFEAEPSVRALLTAALDPLFWRPSLVQADSAWHGHIPFAHWIIRATAPRVFVELGTHAGVSYAAFCDAVLREKLGTRCFAVDTWKGDEHAGFYGEEIFNALRTFHDQRYSAFSQMLRCTFDEALSQIDDDSVDLLHIDGRHLYEDVRYDFDTWVPKLSARAVVLFHDTNVRERDFGVVRLWGELTARYPGFEFLHEHGLGVLAFGPDVPAPAAALCRLREPAEVAVVRERFTLLGERWSNARDAAAREATLRAFAQKTVADFDALQGYVERVQGEPGQHSVPATRQQARLATARATAADAETRLALARAAVAEARAAALAIRVENAEKLAAAAAEAGSVRAEARLYVARDRIAELELRAAVAEAQQAALLRDRESLLASTSWRLTRPLRHAVQLLSGWRQRPMPSVPAQEVPELAPAPAEQEQANVAPADQPSADEPAAPAEQAPELAAVPTEQEQANAAPAEQPAPNEPAAATPTVSTEALPESAPPRPRIVFVAGEPGTPGEIYRCTRHAEAAAAAGWDPLQVGLADLDAAMLRGAELVVFWRCTWHEHVRNMVRIAHLFGVRVVFDIDDLMFRPELARISIIDGIRTIDVSEGMVRRMYGEVQQLILASDLCTCTTRELARDLRVYQKAVHVLPNGFDEAAHRLSRQLVRARRAAEGDGLVRLGYAGGTRTHQMDFQVMAGPLARVLRERPETRLVLFQDPIYRTGQVDIEEFPELAGLQSQIEWRDMVPLVELPRELARFAINLAPLQVGNPFCEAKSELKYFEAALVDVPTVASPTGPLRRAIRHGATGLLADTKDEWYAALLGLVDDPALRTRLARAAYYDVLWPFGPQKRTAAMVSLLHQHRGRREGSRSFMFDVGLELAPRGNLPEVPAAEVLFAHDALGEAEVTVVITSCNYADFLLEALESVRIQTLPALDLVVVDDGSTDDSVEVAVEWAKTYTSRFNRVMVLRTRANAGLGGARNVGFDAAETPTVLPLDADNRLRPEACEKLLAALRRTGAAFVYPQIQQFGADERVLSDEAFLPMRLVAGNYIDAMALVGKWAWAACGGYYVRRDAMGWEDFSLWCRLVELGLWGEPVAELLADYRVHPGSMTNTNTETADIKPKLVQLLEQRHPWLDLISRAPRPR
jgi:glycosyltransferase involved in cell wall biosynthesis